MLQSSSNSWLFSSSQVEAYNRRRHSKFPPGYTVEKETQLIQYYIKLLRELFKLLDHDNQLNLFCTTAYLFRKHFLKYSIFEKKGPSEMQQISLVCAYLSMKINEVISANILKLAQKLREKPKHEKFIHYGTEGYMELEIQFTESLNFEINTPQLYGVVQAINYLFRLQEQLDQYLYSAYEKQLKKYCINLFMTDLIFYHVPGLLATTVCECSLLTVLKDLSENPGQSSILGPSNRPIPQLVENRLKQVYRNYLNDPEGLLIRYFEKDSQVNQKIYENTPTLRKLVAELSNFVPPPDNTSYFSEYERALMIKPEFKRPEKRV